MKKTLNRTKLEIWPPTSFQETVPADQAHFYENQRPDIWPPTSFQETVPADQAHFYENQRPDIWQDESI
jgi:phosphoribosyl-AMP cyclohydrolase